MLSDAVKCFQENVKNVDVRGDRQFWNLNNGLMLLCEALDQRFFILETENAQLRQSLAQTFDQLQRSQRPQRP